MYGMVTFPFFPTSGIAMCSDRLPDVYRINEELEKALDDFMEYEDVVIEIHELIEKIAEKVKRIDNEELRSILLYPIMRGLIEAVGIDPIEAVGYLETLKHELALGVVVTMDIFGDVMNKMYEQKKRMR